MRKELIEPTVIFERGELDKREFTGLIGNRFFGSVNPKVAENNWKPTRLTYLGCQEGCLDYLGMDICMAWSYRAVGHVLIVNIHDIKCPCEPSAWGDIDLKDKFGYNANENSISSKTTKKREYIWEEINNLLCEVYPVVAGSGISPGFMSSLAKMINNVILQIQASGKMKPKNKDFLPVVKLGYWRSDL